MTAVVVVRVPRKVRHALFAYDAVAGGQEIGLRGQVISVTPEDAERGDRMEALVAADVDLANPAHLVGQLPPFDPAADSSAQRGWIANGTVEEVLAAVRANPAVADRMLALEIGRGAKARRELLEALGQFVTDGMVH